jgi:hypothetical protein
MTGVTGGRAKQAKVRVVLAFLYQRVGGLPSHLSENRHDNLDLENSSGAGKPTQRFATRVSADRHRFSGIRIKRALSDNLFEPATTIQLKPLERDESSVLFRTRS